MSVARCNCRTVHEDFDRCYRAVQSKDARFDGWFVTAVLTTGIYCRPSCPVRPPFARNVRFYPTAAAAQRAGFRACKRCRPDASPGSPEWNIRDDLVARAMRLIADGTVDREGVAGLAARLGYTTRQLQRLLQAETGAGPLALARAQRTQTARILIETTDLPFGDVAFAAGFSSIRQFNDTLRLVCDSTPTELRKRATARLGRAATDVRSPGTVSLRLPVRVPFAYEGSIRPPRRQRGARMRGSTRRRLSAHPAATVRQRNRQPDTGARSCPMRAGARRLSRPDDRDLALPTTSRPRRRPGRRDRRIEFRCRAGPGGSQGTRATHTAHRRRGRTRRSSGAGPAGIDQGRADPRRPIGHRVRRSVHDANGALTHTFPSIEQLGDIDPAHLAVPNSRRRTVTGLVAALADGSVVLNAGCDWDAARSQLLAVPGIGPWTAEVIAMRGLGDPDAFPASDLGLRLAAEQLGLPSDQRELSALKPPLATLAFLRHAISVDDAGASGEPLASQRRSHDPLPHD